MESTGHWQSVYTEKAPDSVSWFQASPTMSLALIAEVAASRNVRIVDIGGGASTLVDGLLDAGYTSIAVLDLAPASLVHAQIRLGDRAQAVTWIAADVLATELPAASVDIWHDRAVFHFLTAPEQRAQYLAQVRHALRPGGHVVIATFAEDGPTRCSGLPVARYSASALHEVFGHDFDLVSSHREVHTTPSGGEQAFTYCVFRLR